MKPKEVERAIGDAHYDIERNGRTIWQYGKCGSYVQGTVVFEAGTVLFWQLPSF
jgi:hypothetical protein